MKTAEEHFIGSLLDQPGVTVEIVKQAITEGLETHQSIVDSHLSFAKAHLEEYHRTVAAYLVHGGEVQTKIDEAFKWYLDSQLK